MELKKITTVVPQDLYDEMHTVIPWGLRRHVMVAALTLIVGAAKRDGSLALGAIMDNKFKLVIDDHQGG